MLNVIQSWSGNELEPNIRQFLARPRTQNGVSTNCVVAGIIVIMLFINSINITAKNGDVIKLSFIPLNYQLCITGYVVITLFVAAVSIWRKSFITPDIKSFECHYCGATMATSELTCQRCTAISSKGKTNTNEPS